MKPLLVLTLVGLESRLVCLRIPCRPVCCLPSSTTIIPPLFVLFAVVVVVVVAAIAVAEIVAAAEAAEAAAPPPLPTSINLDGRFVQNTGFEEAAAMATAALLTALAPGLFPADANDMQAAPGGFDLSKLRFVFELESDLSRAAAAAPC